MGNLKLTVDDLIVEYMMYKVKNGYEPSFLTSEFMEFLHLFECEMNVEDVIYDNKKLFQRFFERKCISNWSRINDSNEKKHIDMIYSEKDEDYLIKANYKFSIYDESIINTYRMNKDEVFKIRSIIESYVSSQSKRVIDENIETNEKELMIGKYITAEIIANIWASYIEYKVESHNWPKQCSDINKYLFEIDLAEIIGVKSIKNDLIKLYNELSKRIAILYHQDKNLRISTHTNVYLARANYELLIQGFEKIMEIAFSKYKKSLEIDLKNLTFKESHELGGVYSWDEDPDIKVTTNTIENDNVKKLVISFDKNVNS